MTAAVRNLGAEAGGFVLAGGQSSRMGTDKALIDFRGRRLVDIALNTLAASGLVAHIAGLHSPLAFPFSLRENVPGKEDAVRGSSGEIEAGNRRPIVVFDLFTGVGPMGGIQAGLAASSFEWNVFLPVDMPLMPAELLVSLLGRAVRTGSPVTAVRLNGRLEPFPVVLHRSVTYPLLERLRSGETACHAAWHSIPRELGARLDAPAVEILAQAGLVRHSQGLPSTFWFESANKPADLARLQRICSEMPSW